MNTFLNAAQISLQEKCLNFIKTFLTECPSDSQSIAMLVKDLNRANLLTDNCDTNDAFIQKVLLIEGIANQDPGLAYSLASHLMVIEFINKFGNKTVKEKYLNKLYSGEIIASYAFHEIQAGSDLSAMQTSCIGNKLSGHKTWVVNGNLTDLILVLAKNNTLILIENNHHDQSIETSQPILKLGLDKAITCDITFNSHEIINENIFNAKDLNNSNELINFIFDTGKVLVAACCIGLLESAINEAILFARERSQFGKKISTFQAIQFKIADIEINLASAKLLTYRAAWSIQTNHPEARLYAAMAKSHASLVARCFSAEAIQISGSKGIVKDCILEKFYRDAKVLELTLETNEMQKNLIASLVIQN